MRFDGITIVTDMDGTLLDNSKRISEKNLKAIEYFKQNGGNFTIASGRLHTKISSYADIVSYDIPVIAGNGSVIYNFTRKETMYKKIMDPKCLDTAGIIHEEFPDTGLEVASIDFIYFIYPNKYVDKHIKDENFYGDYENGEIVWSKFEDVAAPITKIMFCDEPSIIDKLDLILPKMFSKYSFFKSDVCYYEMFEPNTNKGSAIPRLEKILGNRSKKIYAVGDNMNDLEMLQNSDMGICVKNANPLLKEESDFILPYTNEEDAIFELIKLIDKGVI